MDQSLASEFMALVERHLRTEGNRRSIMQSCCPALLARLNLTGSASEFASETWAILSAYGEVEPGKPATVAFLMELRQDVGIDQQEIIDALVYSILDAHMRTTPNTPPPPTDDIPLQYTMQNIYALRDDVSRLIPVAEDVKRVAVVVDQHDTMLRGNGDGRQGLESKVREICSRLTLIFFLLLLYGVALLAIAITVWGTS